MKHVNDVLHTYQATNDVGMGVSFTEEAFNQFISDYNTELKVATGRGILIGAAGVGLTCIGIVGWNKFKNRKPKVKKKDKGVLEGVEINTIEPEVIDINDNEQKSRVVSRKKTEALGEIITEINDNGKKTVKRK